MTDEQEFEMLVNAMIAQKRVIDAQGWCRGNFNIAAQLANARNALDRVKDLCSEENQRLATMHVAGQ